ncbi:ATP-dependent nuclease [Parabacteroides timonensis]|uniref:ATP-dependent nuclease n=1 Tax=Parabacteroides timonensis TaxID=1871013 RepID=UPI00094EF8B2|nr:AAA family ATPase [Parabacteroides timonensis]
MYISKIHIVGYRNFKDKEISFKEGINVIIGPNNAGKSNLLRALDLVLNAETTKKLTLFDFCRDSNLNELKVAAPKVRIEVFFRESEGEGSNSEDLVMVAPCLIKLEHPYEAQVTFDYFLPKEDEDEYKDAVSDITDEEKIWNIIRDEYLRKYVSRMWAGNPTNQSKLDGETVDKIDFEFLGPIRDVERDLFSGKSPLLREVLNFFLDYEIKSNKGKTKDEQKAEIKVKHKDFTDSIRPSLDKVQERLMQGKEQILAYAKLTGASDFRGAIPDFSGSLSEPDFLAALQLIIKHETGIDIAATHNGLGYNNLIYISLLLAKMQANADEGYYRQNAKEFSVLAIEEPEAHLHLSLQYKFLKYLQEEQVKKKRVRQLFITTHSTEITSAVSLDELICLYNDLEDKIAVGYPGSLFDDSEGDIVSKQYVQRFLDAIKSDMLFADRICFVEGKAEELLIPVMANYIEKSIEDGHVAVISVGGRYFSHFLKLFDTVQNPLAMKKKVVCLTDRDPMWRKEDSNSFERCYPFELGLEGNEYQEHSKTMIETFHEHPNIRVYSQDEIKGKTLEYDLMWYNSVSDLLFLEDLSNKKELEEIQSEDYPACAEKLRNSSENKRIKEALNLCTWTNEDKKKALLASRYLNSIGKGENALALSVILKNNLEKQSTERKDFIVPKYIKDALVWLLQ